MYFTALRRPYVSNLVAAAVYLLFPCLAIAGCLVAWYPAQVDVFGSKSVDLFPDPDPDVNHRAADIKAVPFPSVKGFDMVLVVGDDEYGR